MEKNNILVRDLCKQFDGFLLDHVSFQVPKGRIVGFIGENGAGKSTTVKAVLGLIFPDRGTVEVFGKPAEQMTKEDREKLGIVLPNACFSEYLCLEDLIPIFSRLYSRFEEKDFLNRCSSFGLPMKKRIRELSMEAARHVKAEGRENDLLELIAADGAFNLTLEELQKTMDPARYVGCAPRQVDVFLEKVVDPILEENREFLGLKADIHV